MTLVDTSVWIDHLRRGNARLRHLLTEGSVTCHPFVAGELACGHLKNRAEILGLLRSLPVADVVDHEEALGFVETHSLAGSGLGWVDVHLLASATLGPVRLWTVDANLKSAAERLNCAAFTES